MTDSHSVPPGKHLIIDFWQAQNLCELSVIKSALTKAAEACGANILETNLHEFGEGHGVTGVVILAESHISIHTWPEISYAAIDIFMCGGCDPNKAIPILESAFTPQKTKLTELTRGIE